MEVIATKVGFFGASLRNVGDRFTVPDGAKASWWVPAESAAGKAAKAKVTPKESPRALSELAKGAKSFIGHVTDSA